MTRQGKGLRSIKKTMIFEEAHKGLQREIFETLRVGRPQGRAQRGNKLFNETGRETLIMEGADQGNRLIRNLQKVIETATETKYLQNHTPERRGNQVFPLGEEGVEVMGIVFQSRFFAFDAEGHPAGLGGHPQPVQYPAEIRVSDLIENDEPGVHRIAAFRQSDFHGVGVPAHIPVGLIHREVKVPVQQVSGRKARDARTDNGDFHRRHRFPGGPALERPGRFRDLSA